MSTSDEDATPPLSEPFELAALSGHELDLLTVLALEPGDTSCSSWAAAAARYGLHSSEQRALTGKGLEPLCSRLLAAGVLVPSYSADHFQLRYVAALGVLEACHDRGRLAKLATTFERTRSQRRLHSVGTTLELTGLRLAVLLGDARMAQESIARLFVRDRISKARLVIDALGTEPRPEWIPLLPDDVRPAYLLIVIELATTFLLPIDPTLLDLALAEQDKTLSMAAARLLALRGDDRPLAALGPLPRWGAEGLAVLRAFFGGRYAEAAALGSAALDKMTTRKHRLLPDMEGACHMLALAATSSTSPRNAAALGALITAAYDAHTMSVDDVVLTALEDIHRVLTGRSSEVHEDDLRIAHLRSFLQCIVWLLHALWITDERRAPSTTPPRRRANAPRDEPLAIARAWQARARAGGYLPVARELSAIATALEGGPRTDLVGAFDPPAAWETALASLEAAVERSERAGTRDAPPRRLVWEISVTPAGMLEVLPRIVQSTRAKKGRGISITRLLEGAEDGLLDAADRAVLAGVELPRDRWPSLPAFGRRAVAALVGHPRVISERGVPLSVERGTPTIVTRRREGQLHVELQPPALLHQELVCVKPDPARVVVYERPAALEALASVLAHGRGLAVPDAARDRLARVLAHLGATTAVTMEGDLSLGVDTRPADPRPLLQLGWDGSTLDVRVRVAPLGPGGPHLQPGTGSATLVAEVIEDTGTRLSRCERDTTAELVRHRALLEACPVLAGFAEEPLHHRVPSLPDALDVLLELDALGETVTLAWAVGGRLHPPRRAELSQLRVEVGSRTDWLSVTGTLTLDEGAVLHFAELLGSRPGGRYVPLGRDRFVALSDSLRRYLDSLASLGTVAGTELRASPALVSVLDELALDTEVSFDEAARARLAALQEIGRFVPRIPRGFEATLRDYQREGFVWLSRLSRAGLGACLADDMGLGKTVQALALLCQRARLGPAMVLCPTSVVLNWVAEAARFSPTLRVHVLAHADDRGECLRSLGARDLLICSYGLLSAEIGALAQTSFTSIVFDEAHALKNQTTKRAGAAGRLRAEFRLALTGTPVENHLGELWSLFNLLVPGLLGGRSRFDETFAAPIVAGDRERGSQLRALLRPFLLRRTKAQVLDELPPRSEITIRIEPYPKERAFYEAARRRAAERVAAADPKKARFEIMAELTRLRQAAIDPRLLDVADAPPGAKLDVLLERLEQLREQGHRALVFTQFLGSMALVRARLRAAGIEHFELDGSTPTGERARRIEAFQAGEGDVFVLSLRAGGLGVNLTGADYVFHLDPWWNPAVEDQATDRAHRIGQRRPVTVYRLVTEGTVEDKILALHETKRQLADDVLAGHERATTPDLDELRRLLEQ